MRNKQNLLKRGGGGGGALDLPLMKASLSPLTYRVHKSNNPGTNLITLEYIPYYLVRQLTSNHS